MSFLFSRAAQQEALGFTLLGAGFLYGILSASSLDPNSSGPKGPFDLMWLSLPHLVSNWLQLNWNSDCQLPLPLPTASTSVLTALYNSSTPTRLPTRSLKSMFNRHQAEITVMQFTGHSLPVHQSMSVSWALPCPISSANFRPRDFLS